MCGDLPMCWALCQVQLNGLPAAGGVSVGVLVRDGGVWGTRRPLPESSVMSAFPHCPPPATIHSCPESPELLCPIQWSPATCGYRNSDSHEFQRKIHFIHCTGHISGAQSHGLQNISIIRQSARLLDT